jgi:hypothetical protein
VEVSDDRRRRSIDQVVVFLVLSHHQPSLVKRLVERLSDTGTALTVVHHDPRAPEPLSFNASARAMLIPHAASVDWGAMNTVTVTLACLRWIRREIPNVGYVALLSGQDYPVMSPRSVEAELLSTEVDAFIHWEIVPSKAGQMSSDWQRGASRRYYWHRVPGRFRPVPVPRLRRFFDQVPIFAGSQWWNLSRIALDRILDAEPRLEYLTRSRFKGTYLPDEAFFQTALLNAPVGLRIANDHRRFYRFPRTGGAGHPEILAIRDLDAILASNAFFARKMDELESRELLDRLDTLAA